jgi:hypothetical protein
VTVKNVIVRVALASFIVALALGCAKNADSVSPEPVIPDSPDGTVLAISRSLSENHPEILWAALPESYRQDINEITRSFAEKMDPALYNRSIAILRRAIQVLDDRKDIILASQTFQSTGVDPVKVSQGLSSAVVVSEILLGSQIATLDGLATVEWEQFLGSTGAQLLVAVAAIEVEDGGNPMDAFDSLKVETIESSGDSSTLRISSEGHEPEDVKMARVEGRWIPAEMADGWSKGVTEAREGLAEITPETLAAQKTQAMMFFGMADGLIEQIALMQTPEEFDAAIGPMLQPFLGMGALMTDDDDEDDWSEEDSEEVPEE